MKQQAHDERKKAGKNTVVLRETHGLGAQIVAKADRILQGVGLRPWVGSKTAAYFTVQERALEIAIQTVVPMVALFFDAFLSYTPRQAIEDPPRCF